MIKIMKMYAYRCVVFGVLIVSLSFLQVTFQDSLATEQSERLTAKVVKKNLPLEVILSGTFQADDKEEVIVKPKAYKGELIVKSILSDGSTVKKGDVLIEFDESSLNKSIEDAKNALKQADVNLQKAVADLESFKIDYETSRKRLLTELEHTKKSLEDKKGKLSITLKDKEKAVRDAENGLKDIRVDLEQLLELYNERELHTATENILIERNKRRVKESERNLAKAQKTLELFKKYEMGKDVEIASLDLEKKEAEIKKFELKNKADLAEKEAKANQMQRELDNAKARIADLENDAKNLRIQSPREGVLFYGSLRGGNQFGDVVIMGRGAGDITKELRIGGRVQTHVVLFTVASMENLSVNMDALESDIQHIKEGQDITITPDAFPALHVRGKVSKVNHIAKRQGFFSNVRQFPVQASYEGTYPQLRAGMNCQVVIHAESVPDAIQVPVLAVFEEGGEHYCLVKDQGKASRRPVKLGKTNGKMVHITEGLKPDQEVYLYNPNEE